MGESEPVKEKKPMAPFQSSNDYMSKANANDHANTNVNTDANVNTNGNTIVNTNTSGTDSFGAGMYVTLWPKVEKCHKYVSVLLAAQEQLQETIEELLTGLREAEKLENYSLVQYADRLQSFPQRVETLQSKLELIEERLLSMKASQQRRPRVVVVSAPPTGKSGSTEPSHQPSGSGGGGASRRSSGSNDEEIDGKEDEPSMAPTPMPMGRPAPQLF